MILQLEFDLLFKSVDLCNKVLDSIQKQSLVNWIPSVNVTVAMFIFVIGINA